MHKPQQNIEKAILLAVFAMCAFSMSDGLRKMEAAAHGLMEILFWQGVFALMVLMVVSPFLGGVKTLLKRQNLGWHFLRGLLIALNTTFSIIAVSHVPMMDAYTIFFLTPFVTTLLSMFFFRERFGIYRWMAIFVGFLGAFIAFRPGFSELHWAYIFACACVFTFAFSSIIARKIGHGQGTLGFGVWPILILLIGILIVNGFHLPYHYDAVFLAYCAVIGACYGLALVTIAHSYTLAPASVIAPYQYIQIIFALGFGYFVFNDVPDAFKILGAGIIIASGVFLFMRERIVKKRAAAQSQAQDI